MENYSPKILELPDYLISNIIFPFLSKKELYIDLRSVHPYLNNIIKISLGSNYKQEIKNLLIKEKENLIKEYENKICSLTNIRNLLLFYNINLNILEMFKLCIDYLNNENILKLIIIFSEIFFENDLIGILLDEKIKIENKKNILNEIINNINTSNEYILRFSMLLDLDNNTENELFNGLKIMFLEIDEENVENINESCSVINSFLQNLFHFQQLKIDSNNIKLKIDNLSNKT